jgi:predicted ATPase
MNIIQYILADSEVKHLLLVMAYRDNEVNESTFLANSIQRISETLQNRLHKIHLEALPIEEITKWLVDSLNPSTSFSIDENELLESEHKRCKELAEFLLKRSNGNPLYIQMLIENMYEQGLFIVERSHTERVKDAASKNGNVTIDSNDSVNSSHSSSAPDMVKWTWNMEDVVKMQAHDDIVHLMLARIEGLPETAIEVLKIASCLGISFDLSLLAAVMNKLGHHYNVEVITELILPAYVNGLITSTAGNCAFVHDKVKSSFYNQLSDTTKYRIHLTVGRYILEQREKSLLDVSDTISNPSSDSDSKYDNLLTEGLYHLNQGIPQLLEEIDEKTALHYSSLNMNAAAQSKQAIAYESALMFLKSAIEFFKFAQKNNEIWSKENHDYGFSLYSWYCDILVLNHKYEEAQETVAYMEKQGQTILHKATTQSILLSIFAATNAFEDMITVGIKALNILSIHIPKEQVQIKKTLVNYIEDIDKILERRTLTELSINQITNEIIVMKDQQKSLAMRVMASLFLAAQAARSDLYPLLITMSTLLSLQHGVDENTPFAFSLYSNYIITHEAQYKNQYRASIQRAYDFGTLAMRLADMSENAVLKCKAYYTFAAFNATWFKSLKESMQIVEKAYNFGVDSGEILFSSLARAYHGTNMFFSDSHLTHTGISIDNHVSYLEKINNKDMEDTMRGFSSLFKTLQIAFHEFDDTAAVNHMKEKKMLFSLTEYLIVKGYILFILSDGENRKEKLAIAYKCLLKAQLHMSVIKGRFIESVLNMLLVIVPTSMETNENVVEDSTVYINRLASWAETSSQNFSPMYLLAMAELKRIEAAKVDDTSPGGRGLGTVNIARLQAADMYNRAIVAAEEGGYFFLTSLSNELCAKFILGAKNYPNQKTLGQFYLERSFYEYKSWQAFGKCALLSSVYQIDLDHNSSASTTESRGSSTIKNNSHSVATINSQVFESQSIFLSSFTRPTANTIDESNILKVCFYYPINHIDGHGFDYSCKSSHFIDSRFEEPFAKYYEDYSRNSRCTERCFDFK